MNHNWIKQLTQVLICVTILALPFNILAQNNLITSVDCASSRPQFEFNIANAWETSIDVCPHTTALVGDIDGDGKAEVLALSNDKSKIYVYEGATGASIGSIDFETPLEIENPTCFLLVDTDHNGKAEIFAAGSSTQKVYLYEVSSNPGVHPITFSQIWQKPFSMGGSGVTPIVADLDGDGNVEFVAGQHIISHNGDILATLPYGSVLGYGISIAYVADVNNDGLPEIMSGSDVYKYSNGTLTLYARCPNFPGGHNGQNMSADINLDGNIDLVFNSGAGVTVWTPRTNTIIGNIDAVIPATSSYPFIGDIDGVEVNGKKYPEFCINTVGTLYAFSFDGNSFSIKWTLTHSDRSGVTSLTLFDFNLDGVVELIYRDETTLRIFDGRGSDPVVLYSTPCYSGTTTETPVVADVTGDGSADIIVTGHPGSGYEDGRVYVFEGAASKWASCPSVWNQQMYSPLWVNLDLTIPQTIQSQALDFQQTCGNGIKTTYYNGGPMQAPFISASTHCPFDFSSDVFVVSGSRTINGTSITISITYGNQGMANASGSIPIRFYKDAITPGNVIGSTTLGADVAGADLLPGQTRTITRTFTVSPMSLQFYVRALDDGSNFPAIGAFSDCDLTNNTKAFGTLELSKEVTNLSSCLGGNSVFSIKLTNDAPNMLNNIVLTDSLGVGWDFVAASPANGTTVGSYNASTRSLTWTIPSLAPGSTVELLVTAKSQTDGKLENFSWVKSVNGTVLAKDIRSAYVLVSNNPAPVLNSIADNTLCAGSMQSAITFSGSDVVAASCTWTNNHPEIGLAAAGAGNIPAFATINSTGSSITATIKVTPVSSDGCIGVPQTFTIEVTPAIVPAITIQATPN